MRRYLDYPPAEIAEQWRKRKEVLKMVEVVKRNIECAGIEMLRRSNILQKGVGIHEC